MTQIAEPIAIEPHSPDTPGLSTPEEKSIQDQPYSPTSSDEGEDVIDTRAERHLVWRLDLIFLFVGFLGYVFKYLDQTNIVSLPVYCLIIADMQSNAYVSGMKEDLNLYGNELNLFTTFFKYVPPTKRLLSQYRLCDHALSIVYNRLTYRTRTMVTHLRAHLGYLDLLFVPIEIRQNGIRSAILDRVL